MVVDVVQTIVVDRRSDNRHASRHASNHADSDNEEDWNSDNEEDMFRQQKDEIASVLEDVNGPSHELYYPTVAISALVRVLRDPTLGMHHSLVATSDHVYI